MRMLRPLSTGFSWPNRTMSPERMGDMFEDFDRIVDSFLRPTIANTLGSQPSCDVNETKENYLVSLDMPGVKKQHIKIEIQGNRLVISGERHRDLSQDAGDTTYRYERTFVLPATINAEKIEAHYEDGVLTVALPKAETAKGRTIEVQSGQGGFLSKLLTPKKDSNRELKDVKIS